MGYTIIYDNGDTERVFVGGSESYVTHKNGKPVSWAKEFEKERKHESIRDIFETKELEDM